MLSDTCALVILVHVACDSACLSNTADTHRPREAHAVERQGHRLVRLLRLAAASVHPLSIFAKRAVLRRDSLPATWKHHQPL